MDDMINKGQISSERPYNWLLKAMATPAVHARLTLDLLDSVEVPSYKKIDRILFTRPTMDVLSYYQN